MAAIDLSDKIFTCVKAGIYQMVSVKYKDKIKDRDVDFNDVRVSEFTILRMI